MREPLIVDVESLGLCGPGLPDWETALPILRGEEAYQPEVMSKPSLKHLPPGERRRYTFAIALAVTTAMKTLRLEGAEQIPAVFACSGGDADVINRLCTALLQPGCPVSPQQFVNSVHNAPAGYWSIVERNQAPTMSLSAYDASFTAGLIEAAVQVRSGREKVLLIAYDVPAPMPIWPFRPLSAPFAAAMVLSAPSSGNGAVARLTLDLVSGDGAGETALDDPELDNLRLGNPAARALPLLQALARKQDAALTFAHQPPWHLQIQQSPCT